MDARCSFDVIDTGFRWIAEIEDMLMQIGFIDCRAICYNGVLSNVRRLLWSVAIGARRSQVGGTLILPAMGCGASVDRESHHVKETTARVSATQKDRAYTPTVNIMSLLRPPRQPEP